MQSFLSDLSDGIGQADTDQPLILESRTLYRSCHIVLTETGERMPAINYGNQFYSFFRSERDRARALELATKLRQRDHLPLLTQTPKGFAIWVFEPDALLASQQAIAQSFTDADSSYDELDSSYRLLTSTDSYQTCEISVPDLDKRLSAILYEGRFYSLFKTVDDLQQACQIINRLSYRGDETVIIQSAEGMSLWILEPDGFLAARI
ncbi:MULTISPECIES: hypothetical protein [unclassified Leptolyngbya]|nr:MULTISPECIES: hypothetical protein [unclassified Leptolyngbya]MBD1912351.1 hypothetical protein [Leptolyngbya sp. FACHB-8]MBD2158013.1 hypothetical protein [Leptolyngbya sp. FACHB-16]